MIPNQSFRNQSCISSSTNLQIRNIQIHHFRRDVIEQGILHFDTLHEFPFFIAHHGIWIAVFDQALEIEWVYGTQFEDS